jgi:hypothetical protein
MTAPTVYKSTDASAPTLDGQVGSLITVLKACLVNGYGAKSAAGWTIAEEDSPNHKIIFRNDTVNGSGRYFRFQDNGRVSYSGYPYYNSDRNNMACFFGMHSYSDIDTPVMAFPRVLTGGDLIGSSAYGISVRKRTGTSNPTYSAPWIVVADARTCYLVIGYTDANTTTMPTSFSSTVQSGLHVFGDILPMKSGNEILPEAIAGGAYPGVLDIVTSGMSEGSESYGGIGVPRYILAQSYFLDRSLESGGFTVAAGVKGAFIDDVYGGSVETIPSTGSYMTYPSPINVDAAFQRLFVTEDTDDAMRTYRNASGCGAEVGYLPGLYGCLHTCAASASDKIAAAWANVTSNGKTYLLIPLYNHNGGVPYNALMAIDTGDWWA